MSPVVPVPVEEPFPTLDLRTGAVTFDRGDKVPAWTPEDEREFMERQTALMERVTALMERVTAMPSGDALIRSFKLVRRPKPPTAVTFAVDLSIDRKARATCPECRKRRVLYAIVVGGNAFGGSEPRCARDWGIR